MYKDIISYQLAEGISKKQLLLIAKQVVDGWMKKQTGFIKWEIHENIDGTFTDIVHWNSQEDAKNSEKEMTNIPNGSEWFACYKEGSISSKNVLLITAF